MKRVLPHHFICYAQIYNASQFYSTSSDCVIYLFILCFGEILPQYSYSASEWYTSNHSKCYTACKQLNFRLKLPFLFIIVGLNKQK